MPSELEIYENHADKYDDLISREDYQGHILGPLQKITPLEGIISLDLGAGTGRLARLLAPRVARLHAFDVSKEMLRVCRGNLAASGSINWLVSVADHRGLPMQNRSTDLVVSGWSVSYLAVWNSNSWRSELEKWMKEMNRVLRTGGWILRRIGVS